MRKGGREGGGEDRTASFFLYPSCMRPHIFRPAEESGEVLTRGEAIDDSSTRKHSTPTFPLSLSHAKRYHPHWVPPPTSINRVTLLMYYYILFRYSCIFFIYYYILFIFSPVFFSFRGVCLCSRASLRACGGPLSLSTAAISPQMATLSILPMDGHFVPHLGSLPAQALLFDQRHHTAGGRAHCCFGEWWSNFRELKKKMSGSWNEKRKRLPAGKTRGNAQVA